MDPTLLQQFLDLIRAQTGLVIREQDWPDLTHMLMQRTQALQLDQPQVYYELLSTCRSGSMTATARLQMQQEWPHLYQVLTTGETYLFRDRDQLQTLADEILPILINRQRDATATGTTAQPSLRIWSAGCSTGEELYSLAIVLEQLIPDLPQWQILLLGTDLNAAAITQAQQGLYRDWSFRQTDPSLRQQYFHRSEHNWQIAQRFRHQVTFRQGNLLLDPIPNAPANIHSFDLIICRNVFIYFDQAAIAQVLNRFWQALTPGGYLLTGHSELYEQDLSAFHSHYFPASVVYQRPLSSTIPTPSHSPPNVIAAPPIPTPPPTPSHSPPNVIAASPIPTSPLTPLTSALPDPQQRELDLQIDVQAHYRHALAHAQAGNWQQAIGRCQSALAINATAVLPLYLWAHLAQQQQQLKQAKTLLKKIILLQPTFIGAYLKLGNIYQLQGHTDRARKMHYTAQEFLRGLPPETLIDCHSSETAGDVRIRLQKLMATG